MKRNCLLKIREENILQTVNLMVFMTLLHDFFLKYKNYFLFFYIML